MEIFSWKYLNGRSRVLLWAMSLTKESEHLASRRLSVNAREEKSTVKTWKQKTQTQETKGDKEQVLPPIFHVNFQRFEFFSTHSEIPLQY